MRYILFIFLLVLFVDCEPINASQQSLVKDSLVVDTVTLDSTMIDTNSIDSISVDSCSSDSIILKSTYKILFVGNSLTITNNLPDLVQKAALKKNLDFEYYGILGGNTAILDHWNYGVIQTELKKGIYDFVIVQQGPSSQAFGRQVLIEYGKKVSDLAKQYGTKLAYFMVWPSRTYYYTFDGVIKNHRDAARINKAILLPVGEIWKERFDSTGNFDYYSSDGFHPSIKGSKAAADIIVEHLFIPACKNWHF